MSKGAWRLKPATLGHIVQAAVKAGLSIARVEVSSDGRIILVAGAAEHEQTSTTEANEWDSVK